MYTYIAGTQVRLTTHKAGTISSIASLKEKFLQQGLGAFLIVLAASCYASVALMGKWFISQGMNMSSTLAIRFGGAMIILWLIVIFRQKKVKNRVGPSVLSFFADTAQTLLFFGAVARVGVSMAALIYYTFPFFVFLLQKFVCKQPASGRQWAALAISLVGGVLAISPFDQSVVIDNAYLIGVAVGLGGAVAYSCFLVFGSMYTSACDAITCGAQFTTGTFLGLMVFSLSNGGFVLPETFFQWCGSLYVVVIGTVIPLVCLMKGINLIGANKASLLFTVEPIVTILLAVMIFNERFTFVQVIGCAIILSATVYMQRGPKGASAPALH